MPMAESIITIFLILVNFHYFRNHSSIEWIIAMSGTLTASLYGTRVKLLVRCP